MVGGIEASACAHVEFPAVARALENAVAYNPLGERPECVRTRVWIGEYLSAGSDDDEFCSCVFDANQAIACQVCKRKISVWHTSCAAFLDLTHRENDREVRCTRRAAARLETGRKAKDPRKTARPP